MGEGAPREQSNESPQPADGNGWLEAGTPMQAPRPRDPAYFTLPKQVPGFKAQSEVDAWYQAGRLEASEINAGDKVQVAPSEEQVQDDINNGRLL